MSPESYKSVDTSVLDVSTIVLKDPQTAIIDRNHPIYNGLSKIYPAHMQSTVGLVDAVYKVPDSSMAEEHMQAEIECLRKIRNADKYSNQYLVPSIAGEHSLFMLNMKQAGYCPLEDFLSTTTPEEQRILFVQAMNNATQLSDYTLICGLRGSDILTDGKGVWVRGPRTQSQYPSVMFSDFGLCVPHKPSDVSQTNAKLLFIGDRARNLRGLATMFPLVQIEGDGTISVKDPVLEGYVDPDTGWTLTGVLTEVKDGLYEANFHNGRLWHFFACLKNNLSLEVLRSKQEERVYSLPDFLDALQDLDQHSWRVLANHLRTTADKLKNQVKEWSEKSYDDHTEG